MLTSKLRTGLLAMVAASALGIALAAAPAIAANDDDYQAGDQYQNDQAESDADGAAVDTAANEDVAANDEEIEVTAPRARVRGELGAPLRDVSMSREVSFADLDLTTNDGARTLESRIRSTARNLCRQLDIMHPVKADNSPPCYQTAVNDAMAQAEDAIAQARDTGDENNNDE